MQRKLKIDELITEGKIDCKTFQRIFCLFCFQKATETENTSADYQVEERF